MSSSSAPPPPVPHPSGGGGEEECSSTTSLLLCGTDAADALMTDAMKSCASGVPKLDLTRRGKDLLAKIKTTTPKLLGGGGGGGGGWTSRPSSLYDTYLCGAGGGAGMPRGRRRRGAWKRRRRSAPDTRLPSRRSLEDDMRGHDRGTAVEDWHGGQSPPEGAVSR